MPIYEYICKKCNHQADVMQKVSDEPITACPACGESSFKKLISAPSFQLKGSGWYQTDFKNSGQKPTTNETTKKEGTSSDSGAGSTSKTTSGDS